MAKYQDIGGSGRLFVGQDLDFVFEVLDRDGDPVDVSGWSFSMVISPSTTAAATLTLPGSVSGTYNATRASNTQRVTFSLSDTDSAKLTNKAYHYSVWRTDAGAERPVSYGKFILERTNRT